MKIHLRMLGCRLNQSEIDTMARQFRQQGHEVVDDPTEADQIVVNTCAVTQDATRESRHLIRQLHRANPQAALNVTGCYAQIAPSEIQVLPGVTRIVDNTAKDRLVTQITKQPVELFDLDPLEREPKAGASGRTRAFIKVQDGCDNACTFCVTTVARGAGRSRQLAEIVDEIRYLCRVGYQETVLTGVHLGSYGHDDANQDGLMQLVQAILSDTDVARLRLSSLEPWDLSPTFFDLWQNPRLCRHLHLPLQSGCDATLRRMARRTTQQQFRTLIAAARERIPHVNITTDVIIGFPGETEEEFAISESFIHEMDFAGMHIFRYSKRPGTAAARMRQQIPEDLKKQRSIRLHAISQESEARFAASFSGQTFNVLWEHINGATEHGFLNSGYTDNYVRVGCVHPRVLTNRITPTILGDYDGMRGLVQAIPIVG